jgi:3-oxoadipate enol-lactonase
MRARIAGADIHYDAQGEGPALLLLHGFPLDRGLWDPQFAALAQACTVVRFDLRGFGASPAGEGVLTMERIADDAALLLDHLGLSRAVVVGLSMGGYAAFAFARRHAERLRGLVLTNTRALPDDEEGRRRRAELAEEVRRRGVAAASEAFLPKLLGETTRRARPDLVDAVRAMTLRQSQQGVIDALGGLAARADSRPTLREIVAPTLVVTGAEDVISPPAEAREMHAAIAGSRLAIVPDAGHLSSLESPDAWNAALRAFLLDLR